MPYLNGIDTIRMIREQLLLTPEKQPVILLHSSSDDLALYDECKKLGVRFNLTKPVKSQELRHYLESIHTFPDPEHKESEIVVHGDSEQFIINSNPVILVVEDNKLNMVLITTIVKQMLPNVTVLEAVNGKLAIDIAIESNPTMVFMDIQMPVMGGLEATENIRAHEQASGSHIPIVALTAGAIKGEKEKCLAAGMDDFLTKPIDHKALVEILKKYLSHTQNKT
jgi:CheY-like chemotaxis protein